jgi:hypothetical protein
MLKSKQVIRNAPGGVPMHPDCQIPYALGGGPEEGKLWWLCREAIEEYTTPSAYANQLSQRAVCMCKHW